MPAYNYARFIPAAIESILAQDYPADAIEIIVVDDGSTDGTEAALAPYRDRLTLVRQANLGLRGAVNTGLERASGEYIALLDADDTWLPHKLRDQVDRLEARPGAGLVYSDMQEIDEAGALEPRTYFERLGIRPGRGRMYGELLRKNYIGPATLLVRASLRHTFAPIAPEAPWPDWYIALQVAAVADLEVSDRPVCQYRHHGSNMVRGVRGERWASFMVDNLHFRRWLLRRGHPAWVAAADVLAAHAELERSLAFLIQERDLDVREVIAVEAADAEAAGSLLAEYEGHLRRGATSEAFATAARALACDPFNRAAREATLASFSLLDRAPGDADADLAVLAAWAWGDGAPTPTEPSAPSSQPAAATTSPHPPSA